MKNAAECVKSLTNLLKGLPAPEPPDPAEDGAATDPIAVLIMSFLMWESTTEKARSAYRNLTIRTVDYNDVRVCMAQETLEFIGVRYPRGLERCQRLRAVLRDVLRNVARSLRPGGRFLVMDYLNYAAFTVLPRRPEIDRVIEVITAHFRPGAAEPDVGAVLPRLMMDAGLEVVEVHPLVRIGRSGSAVWAWPDTFFRSYLPRLEAQGALSQGDHRAFFAQWDALSADPAAFLLTPPMVSVIGRKPAAG